MPGHLTRLDLDLIPQLKAQDLIAKRRVLSRTLEGSWTALLKGHGMEFAGFRRYTASDDASRIDWGASLRSNEVVVREFEEYRSVNVLFLIDVSSTMLFSSTRKLKAEHAAEIAFHTAVSLLDNGNAVGFALFNESVVAKQMPGVGTAIVYSLASALSSTSHYGGGKRLSVAVNAVNAMLKQRALVVLVSDFIGMGDGWDRYVKLLAERFDLVGIMVRDPRDWEMPDSASQFVLEDPLTGERMFVDVRDSKPTFDREAKAEEEHVRSVFEAAKAGLVTVRTEEDDLFKPILTFFRRRTAIVRG